MSVLHSFTTDAVKAKPEILIPPFTPELTRCYFRQSGSNLIFDKSCNRIIFHSLEMVPVYGSGCMPSCHRDQIFGQKELPTISIFPDVFLLLIISFSHVKKIKRAGVIVLSVLAIQYRHRPFQAGAY